jgi:dTDP-glucose 4,6-dehydratase
VSKTARDTIIGTRSTAPSSKMSFGWKQSVTFEQELDRTIRWYLDHQDWVESVSKGEYRQWIDANYGARSRE